MGSKGIHTSKIEKSKEYTISERRGNYVEFTNLNSIITVFVDEQCLFADTVNLKETLKKIRWIIIDEIVWTKLIKKYNKDTEKNTRGDSEFFSKINSHIIKEFAGARITVKGSDIENITAGNAYLLMPFTIYPEDMYYNQNVRLVFLKEPSIRYLFVNPPSSTEADIPPGYNTKLHLYGMFAEINVSTHLLPDFRKNNNIVNKLMGTVFFINENNEEVTVDAFEIKLESSEGNYNIYRTFKVYIDPNWRDIEGTHAQEYQSQKYFLKVFVMQSDTSFSLIQYSTTDYNESLRNQLNPPTYNTQKDFSVWRYFDKDAEIWVDLNVQPHIEVRWDTMQMIFRQIEIIKNNQIQYIGDIPFSKKEYDPCGYKSITITEEFDDADKKEFDEKNAEQDKKLSEKKITVQESINNRKKISADFENKRRLPLTIFNEDRLSIDQTYKIFEIISGESKKSVSVKVGGLSNKKVLCKGLLLADGQRHEDKKNVFQIEHMVYSALKLATGDFQKENDETHEEQLKKSKIPASKDNKNDKDVIKNPDNSKIRKVHDVLNWKENEDYQFIGEDELKLNIGYRYIKHLTTLNKEINPNKIGNLFEEAWLFNYFFLNYEDQKQLYYLPVSTCRYPNQIVKINVLPDIKWTLLFKFNFKKEDWNQFEEVHDYDISAFLIETSETSQVTTSGVTNTSRRNTTSAGVFLSRTTTLEPVQRKGGIKRLIEILKRVEVSLTAEWTDESAAKKSKDVIEGFYKPIYDFYKKITDLSKMISAITEGESNDEDREKKKLLEAELKKMAGQRDAKEVMGGIYDIITSKTVETELIYPSIGLALSWYYGDAYHKDKPELTGKKALEYNLQLKANPIVGIQTTLNFLEMLAKKHPIAYIIVKVIQVGMYLAGEKNSIKVSLAITGTLNFESNARYNTLSGSSLSNYHSAKKEKMASLTGEITAVLEGSINIKFNKYQIITEFNASGEFKIGVKTKITPGAHLATDTNGMFYETDLDFEGFTFYLKAEGKAEFLFFGMKIFDWEDSYEPEPWTVGKAYIASEKNYLIQ
jgi:hypothetical protein